MPRFLLNKTKKNGMHNVRISLVESQSLTVNRIGSDERQRKNKIKKKRFYWIL